MLKKVLSRSKAEVLPLRNPFVNTAADLSSEVLAKAGDWASEPLNLLKNSESIIWSGWGDLNSRSQRPERCALPLGHIPLKFGVRSARNTFIPQPVLPTPPLPKRGLL